MNQRLRERGRRTGEKGTWQMGLEFSTPGQPEQLCPQLFDKLGDGICKQCSVSKKGLKTTIVFYNHRVLPIMPTRCCIKGRTSENISMLIG